MTATHKLKRLLLPVTCLVLLVVALAVAGFATSAGQPPVEAQVVQTESAPSRFVAEHNELPE
jgi:hypothetical protein